MHTWPPVAWLSSAAVAEFGTIPPGNAPGETRWQSRTAKPPRPEIRLTAGKGVTGVTVEQLVDQVVKDVKVRKGQACGTVVLWCNDASPPCRGCCLSDTGIHRSAQAAGERRRAHGLGPSGAQSELPCWTSWANDLCSPRLQVVAFIKGTRTQPQCGFSHKMLTLLNTLKAEYEVVNVLDEVRRLQGRVDLLDQTRRDRDDSRRAWL